MFARCTVAVCAGFLAVLSLGSAPADSVPVHAPGFERALVSGLAPSPPAGEWPPRFISAWGIAGDQEGEFNDPNSAAIDAAGNVYVVDSLNYRIQKFDSTGSFLRTWGYGVQDGLPSFQKCTSGCQTGIAGTGLGQFSSPSSVAVDAYGDVFVADSPNRIQRFDSYGNFLIKWGSYGAGAGEFAGVRGISFDADGYLYVVDGPNQRIQKLDSNGNFERMWGWGVDDGTSEFQTCTITCQQGISGGGGGQFDSPLGVVVDSSGNVYVSDFNNHRIQKFTTDGAFVETWGWGVQDGSSKFQVCSSGCQAGIIGSGDGQFAYPRGVGADRDGHLYVVAGYDRIQVFDDIGRLLTKWGTYGTGDGEFNSPSNVAVADSGNIYVCDTKNDRLQRFFVPALDNFIARVLAGSEETVAGVGR